MMLQPAVKDIVQKADGDVFSLLATEYEFESHIVHRIECFLIQVPEQLFFIWHMHTSFSTFIPAYIISYLR